VPTYDAATGHPTKLTGPGAETSSFAYDGSRPTSWTTSGTVNGSLSWDYDTRGRVIHTVLDGQSSTTLTTSYDEDDLVVQHGPVTLTRDDATGWVTDVKAAGTYETIERTVSENGASVSYGQPTHWRLSANGGAPYDLKLERDLLGRITRRVELLDGTTRTFDYGYDEAGRLSSVQLDGVKKATHTYDSNGNRLTEDGAAVLGTYDEQDRVLTYQGATYEHDVRGNRTSRVVGGVVTTYEHDTRGALRKVKAGAKEIAYAVDAIGRRIARTEDGVVTARWLYQDALRPAAEYDDQGSLRWQFVYATDRHVPDVAINGAGEKYRLVTDQIGSLRLVIRGSDGVVVQRMRHDAWGRVEEDFVAAGFARVPFGFAGGMSDQVTGLVHFGAREYDPEIGRWVERDPIGFGGGLNMYVYVNLDPLRGIDPSGLDPFERFASAEEAAIDAIEMYLPFTRDNGVEVAGLIFQDPLGGFFYMDPVIGTARGVNALRQAVVRGCHVVADYHTHPYSDVTSRRLFWLQSEEPPTGVGFSGSEHDGRAGDTDAYRERATLFSRPDYVGYMGSAEGTFHSYDVMSGAESVVQLP
jgi:RHS repeat-associated protein